MGLPLFKNCSVYPETKVVFAPNPNPANFEIVSAKQVGRHIVAIIRYPDCSNFDGVKIVLYLDTRLDTLFSAQRLDPHFDQSGITPFARFRPTNDGEKAALFLAESLNR